MTAKKADVPYRTPKIFIDTNVIVRFFVRDNERMYEDCKALFARVERGDIKPYLSAIVLFELVYVLTRTYRFTKDDAISILDRLLKMRNLSFIERTDTPRALALWQSIGIKYGDCLIAAQIPKGVVLVTYDTDFDKIEGLK